MLRVVIESPLSPANGRTFEDHQRYARWCCLDALFQGYAPLASHLLYTQMLEDRNADARELGMEAGFAWNQCAELVLVYVDLGAISSGMAAGIERARRLGIPAELTGLRGDLLAAFQRGEGPVCTPGALSAG